MATLVFTSAVTWCLIILQVELVAVNSLTSRGVNRLLLGFVSAPISFLFFYVAVRFLVVRPIENKNKHDGEDVFEA